MKKEQQVSGPDNKDILQLVDNTNRKYTLGRNDYLLLIKKQKDKDYCTLYITDCDTTFWIKNIDKIFFQELKDQMSINTELQIFCKHFVKNIKDKSKLRIQEQSMTVEIQLVIGEGLVMNCSFEVETRINVNQSLNDYKIIMKLFVRQLFDAKQAQIEQERQKWQKIKQQQEDKKFQNHERVDPTYVKQVLNGNLKKSGVIDTKIKNRSLMNPNQKKRKQIGIKFTGQDEG